MKSIKKISILFLIIFLSACATVPKASDAFQQFVLAYKSQDQTYIDMLTTNRLTLYYSTVEDDSSISSLTSKIYSQLLDFEYEIIEENINKDEAELIVLITTYNFNGVIKKGVDEATDYIENSITQDDFDPEAAYVQSFNYIEEAPKDYRVTIKIKLELIDNEWKITNPQVLESAISQNLNEAIKQIEFNPKSE